MFLAVTYIYKWFYVQFTLSSTTTTTTTIISLSHYLTSTTTKYETNTTELPIIMVQLEDLNTLFLMPFFLQNLVPQLLYYSNIDHIFYLFNINLIVS